MSTEPEPLVAKTLVYRLGRLAVRIYLVLAHRMRVEEPEHLPAEGGVLVVANHQSVLDIPLIAASTRRHVAFVARDSLARSPLMAFVMRRSGAILIRRGTGDRAALRAMVAHLERGDCVAVFPEGTRTRDGSLGPFRSGALLAARQAGVPVVPAAIRGCIEALPRERRLPIPRRVAVRYAAPIDPGAVPAEGPDAIQVARERIAERIGDGRYASVPAV